MNELERYQNVFLKRFLLGEENPKIPEYFYIDEPNCAQEKIWNLKKQDEFYQKLEDGQAPLEIQQWYDDFEKISESVIFAHR